MTDPGGTLRDAIARAISKIDTAYRGDGVEDMDYEDAAFLLAKLREHLSTHPEAWDELDMRVGDVQRKLLYARTFIGSCLKSEGVSGGDMKVLTMAYENIEEAAATLPGPPVPAHPGEPT